MANNTNPNIPSSRELWNDAANAGLVLGGIVLLFVGLSYLIELVPTNSVALTFLMNIVSFVLWAAKFVGCIIVMKYFMKRLLLRYPDATRMEVASLGRKTALLSAVVSGGVYLAQAIITPQEKFQEALDTVLSQSGQALDANTTAAMENMMSNLPSVMFFSMTIYCFLYGLVLSSILAGRVAPYNPFRGGNNPTGNNDSAEQ